MILTARYESILEEVIVRIAFYAQPRGACTCAALQVYTRGKCRRAGHVGKLCDSFFFQCPAFFA